MKGMYDVTSLSRAEDYKFKSQSGCRRIEPKKKRVHIALHNIVHIQVHELLQSCHGIKEPIWGEGGVSRLPSSLYVFSNVHNQVLSPIVQVSIVVH